MQNFKARGIIIILLILFSQYSLNAFAQVDCQANDSCSQVNALLSPCKTSLRKPNPGEIVVVQFGAIEAQCYCNQVTYDQLKACSSCINNSGQNENIQLGDLGSYQNVCTTFGVSFTGTPEKPPEKVSPEQPTNPTNNSTDTSSDPQLNNEIPNSINLNSKSSYIILGVVVGIPTLIILIIIIYNRCIKRSRSIKVDSITSQMFFNKPIPSHQSDQADSIDDSSIIV